MKRVLFYITGHGFGHATRTIEVINQLTTRDPELLPLVNTTVPEWLFKHQVAADFEYIQCENDIGAVQKDWTRVDKLETLRRCGRFIENEPEFTRKQLDFAKQNKVAAIVSDIPSIAFVIAKKAGVPGFGLTNFSWDWIYTPYLDDYPQYRFVVDHIRECYSLADRLLRLPFHGDLSAFPVIEDIPLVARRSTRERDEVLQKLGLDANKKIVLLYLGRYDYGKIVNDEMRKQEDYLFVRADTIELGDLSFQDLVKASNVVVTKPGYGIVSDCIANRTPIMYTSREDFREYHVLVDGINKYAHSHFIPREDLLDGRWATHLNELFSTQYEWPEIAINGAEVAAEKVSEVI